MAKQRNSLGFLVMPHTSNEKISWDEYKKITGIDLEKMFVVTDYGTEDEHEYAVNFRHDAPSKLILLENKSDDLSPIPPVAVPKFSRINSSSLALAHLILNSSDPESDLGIELNIYGDKTITGGTF